MLRCSKVLSVGNAFVPHPQERGLCWACDRARIRLLLPADVCSCHCSPCLALEQDGDDDKTSLAWSLWAIPHPLCCVWLCTHCSPAARHFDSQSGRVPNKFLGALGVARALFKPCVFWFSLGPLRWVYSGISSKHFQWRRGLLLWSQLTFGERLLPCPCPPVVSLCKASGAMSKYFVLGSQGLSQWVTSGFVARRHCWVRNSNGVRACFWLLHDCLSSCLRAC